MHQSHSLSSKGRTKGPRGKACVAEYRIGAYATRFAAKRVWVRREHNLKFTGFHHSTTSNICLLILHQSSPVFKEISPNHLASLNPAPCTHAGANFNVMKSLSLVPLHWRVSRGDKVGDPGMRRPIQFVSPSHTFPKS